MEYKNFHRDVLIKRSVQLLNWPHTTLQSPGSMGSSLPVFTKILKAMESGDIRFESLSRKEVERLDNEHEASIAAGELEGPVERKVHSDAGKRKSRKRKQRDSSTESDDESDSRLMKKRRQSPTRRGNAKSKEILSDTDTE